MAKTAIVTDSTADLPVSVINEKKIVVVPLKVNFSDQSYTEGIDITNKQFYEKLALSEQMPTTSQPSPAEFSAVFEDLIAKGYDSILCIHISEKLSGTRQSAVIAGEMVKDKLKHFEAIDSEHVSTSTGLIVQHAAEMAEEGADFTEIVAATKANVKNTQLFVLVDTLKYLEKGGRIGKARALVGSLLNIKPVLTMDHGVITDKEKVRTRKKGVQMMIDLALEKQKSNPEIRLAVSHSQALEEAEKVVSLIREELNKEVEYVSEVGSVVGTHIGPGALFLAFY